MRPWSRLSRNNCVQLFNSYRFPLLLLAIFIINAIFLQQSWMSLIQKKDQIVAVKVANHRDKSKLDSVVMAKAASDPKFDVDVVISIISAGKNSESRSKIRNGWKKRLEDRKDVKVKVLFFIPKTDDYTPQHDDEIVLDFKKKNLRGKAPNDGIIALVIYDWVQTNCRFNLLLRVQDGVFLRTELVDAYKQLKTDPNSTRMIWGSIKYEEPVGDHQYIDVQLIERFIYQLPPHPQPAVFGLSYDVVALLVQHHRQDFLTYYSVEEVSLGVWLIGTRVHWKHDERMSANDCTNKQSFGVVLSNWDSAEENVNKCGHPCVSSC